MASGSVIKKADLGADSMQDVMKSSRHYMKEVLCEVLES